MAALRMAPNGKAVAGSGLGQCPSRADRVEHGPPLAQADKVGVRSRSAEHAGPERGRAARDHARGRVRPSNHVASARRHMTAGGLAERLVRFAATLVGHLRAGLAQTALLSSVLFSGASGSSVANAAFGAKIMAPLPGTTMIPDTAMASSLSPVER
jgi:Tripartite ATP-independent periplasmic transporter, DctM component